MQKISKVAKDLNIGITTALECLHNHGIEIDNSPNARISDEAVELLCAQFCRDKSLKSKADECRSLLFASEEGNVEVIPSNIVDFSYDYMEEDNFKQLIIERYESLPSLPGWYRKMDDLLESVNGILYPMGREVDHMKLKSTLENMGAKIEPEYKDKRTGENFEAVMIIKAEPTCVLSDDDKSEIRKIVLATIRESESKADKEGWYHFVKLAPILRKNGITKEKFGDKKLLPLIKETLGKSIETNVQGTEAYVRFHFEEVNSSDNKKNEGSKPLSDSKYAKTRENTYKRILKFAFFPKPKTFKKNGFHLAIKKLVEKALDEHWFYGKVDPGDFPILRNYFLMTFDRLQSEDEAHLNDSDWDPKIKVVSNKNNTFGIPKFEKNSKTYVYPKEILLFNTGLVDKLYEPIYAVFVTNESPSIPWMFYKFISGSGEDKEHMFLAKLYGDKFPKRAKYYDSTLELVYDIYKPIGSYNWDHFIERCDRLPIEFLEDNCSNEVKASRDSDGNINFATLAQNIKLNTRINLRIKNRIEDAIDHSLKRVEWNFKTAIPIYYPGRKSISLLLPLSLAGDNNEIDVAMVLDNDSDQAYVAHTILTLNMAYANARLITRPDSDWLTPSSISFSTNDSDDIDDIDD